MASGNLTVGSLSQLQLMGGFYAQGTVASSKQTTTMGTFVGSYFDMGTNVPDIYQVPTLADNLPLGHDWRVSDHDVQPRSPGGSSRDE